MLSRFFQIRKISDLTRMCVLPVLVLSIFLSFYLCVDMEKIRDKSQELVKNAIPAVMETQQSAINLVELKHNVDLMISAPDMARARQSYSDALRYINELHSSDNPELTRNSADILFALNHLWKLRLQLNDMRVSINGSLHYMDTLLRLIAHETPELFPEVVLLNSNYIELFQSNTKLRNLLQDHISYAQLIRERMQLQVSSQKAKGNSTSTDASTTTPSSISNHGADSTNTASPAQSATTTSSSSTTATDASEVDMSASHSHDSLDDGLYHVHENSAPIAPLTPSSSGVGMDAAHTVLEQAYATSCRNTAIKSDAIVDAAMAEATAAAMAAAHNNAAEAHDDGEKWNATLLDNEAMQYKDDLQWLYEGDDLYRIQEDNKPQHVNEASWSQALAEIDKLAGPSSSADPSALVQHEAHVDAIVKEYADFIDAADAADAEHDAELLAQSHHAKEGTKGEPASTSTATTAGAPVAVTSPAAAAESSSAEGAGSDAMIGTGSGPDYAAMAKLAPDSHEALMMLLDQALSARALPDNRTLNAAATTISERAGVRARAMVHMLALYEGELKSFEPRWHIFMKLHYVFAYDAHNLLLSLDKISQSYTSGETNLLHEELKEISYLAWEAMPMVMVTIGFSLVGFWLVIFMLNRYIMVPLKNIARILIKFRHTKSIATQQYEQFAAQEHLIEIREIVDVLPQLFADFSRMSEKSNVLEQRYDELLKNTKYDALTKIFNRGSLNQLIKDVGTKTPAHFAVAMIDIDFFKNLNDTMGHQRGDEVLFAVAQTLHGNLSKRDMVFRYGGEEFCVILTEITAVNAYKVANRLCKTIRELKLINEGVPSNIVTVSVGLSLVTTSVGQFRVDELINQADKALYLAKRNGRNQVVACPRSMVVDMSESQNTRTSQKLAQKAAAADAAAEEEAQAQEEAQRAAAAASAASSEAADSKKDDDDDDTKGSGGTGASDDHHLAEALERGYIADTSDKDQALYGEHLSDHEKLEQELAAAALAKAEEALSYLVPEKQQVASPEKAITDSTATPSAEGESAPSKADKSVEASSEKADTSATSSYFAAEPSGAAAQKAAALALAERNPSVVPDMAEKRKLSAEHAADEETAHAGWHEDSAAAALDKDRAPERTDAHAAAADSLSHKDYGTRHGFVSIRPIDSVNYHGKDDADTDLKELRAPADCAISAKDMAIVHARDKLIEQLRSKQSKEAEEPAGTTGLISVANFEQGQGSDRPKGTGSGQSTADSAVGKAHGGDEVEGAEISFTNSHYGEVGLRSGKVVDNLTASPLTVLTARGPLQEEEKSTSSGELTSQLKAYAQQQQKQHWDKQKQAAAASQEVEVVSEVDGGNSIYIPASRPQVQEDGASEATPKHKSNYYDANSAPVLMSFDMIAQAADVRQKRRLWRRKKRAQEDAKSSNWEQQAAKVAAAHDKVVAKNKVEKRARKGAGAASEGSTNEDSDGVDQGLSADEVDASLYEAIYGEFGQKVEPNSMLQQHAEFNSYVAVNHDAEQKLRLVAASESHEAVEELLQQEVANLSPELKKEQDAPQRMESATTVAASNEDAQKATTSTSTGDASAADPQNKVASFVGDSNTHPILDEALINKIIAERSRYDEIDEVLGDAHSLRRGMDLSIPVSLFNIELFIADPREHIRNTQGEIIGISSKQHQKNLEQQQPNKSDGPEPESWAHEVSVFFLDKDRRRHRASKASLPKATATQSASDVKADAEREAFATAAPASLEEHLDLARLQEPMSKTTPAPSQRPESSADITITPESEAEQAASSLGDKGTCATATAVAAANEATAAPKAEESTAQSSGGSSKAKRAQDEQSWLDLSVEELAKAVYRSAYRIYALVSGRGAEFRLSEDHRRRVLLPCCQRIL